MSEKPVILTKSAPVSLRKAQVKDGSFSIFTLWRRAPFFGYSDLDLITMWEDRLGNKGVIQPLGKAFGAFNELPYMLQDGDDRRGGKGERLTGNTPMVLSRLRRICVGLDNYDSRRSLGRVKGATTTFELPGLAPMVVEHSGLTTSVCSIMQIHISPTGELRVENDLVPLEYGRRARFASPQQALAGHWGFRFNWNSTRKD